MSDVLRISTAGSVDDGKSTLIGRLLYETDQIPEDQRQQIGLNRDGTPDLSRLTDGLNAEREQGITIDVAYRYFDTEHRRIILADSPGHDEYTRNMATAASSSDCALILIDAVRGVRRQSYRHALIAATMKTPHVIVVVNKMDARDYSESVFDSISKQFGKHLESLGYAQPLLIPLSALRGDNLVEPSTRMPWYTGPTLLDVLLRMPSSDRAAQQTDFRFPVQLVTRNTGFRGYSGTIASGRVAVGDTVLVLPRGTKAVVCGIRTARGNVESALSNTAVTLTLDGELDIGRGDVLASPSNAPQLMKLVRASVIWFHQRALTQGDHLIVKAGTRSVGARVLAIDSVVDVQTLEERPGDRVDLNDIAKVTLEMERELVLDAYSAKRNTGSFILIDALEHHTLGAGMVADDNQTKIDLAQPPSFGVCGPVNIERFAVVFAQYLSRMDQVSLVLDARIHPASLDSLVRSAGVATIWLHDEPGARDRRSIVFHHGVPAEKVMGDSDHFRFHAERVSPEEAALLVATQLREHIERKGAA